jgi:uncharacterized protein with HEPN domain
MLPQRRAKERLEDIVLWGGFVAQHLAGMSRTSFEADQKTQHAIMKCIEVIGEASGHLMKLMPEHATAFPDLDLRRAYAIRNKLSHGYHETELDLLWIAAIQSVPAVVAAAQKRLLKHDDGLTE